MHPEPDPIQSLIDGHYLDSHSGRRLQTPIRVIEIGSAISDGGADLLGPLRLGDRIAVVSDQNTVDVLARRLAHVLKPLGRIDEVVLIDPYPDEASVENLRDRCRHADALIAVGSGTINDLCKYVSYRDAKPYAVFATAASMNGYTSSTASISVSGVKTSQAAQTPLAIIMDLQIIAAAPLRLSCSGLGDSLCRSTAQFDWWLSHRITGSAFHPGPFELQLDAEQVVFDSAHELPNGLEAPDFYESLCKILTLSGLGVCFTGTSHHASMGEHMISHYIDMMAGDAHPGSLHGEQVGVTTLTMARIQKQLLNLTHLPPLRPTCRTKPLLQVQFGADTGAQFWDILVKKQAIAGGFAALNRRLQADWPVLRGELAALHVSEQRLVSVARNAGLIQSACELGLEAEFYREAVQFARETRDRYSALDLAADLALLPEWVQFEG